MATQNNYLSLLGEDWKEGIEKAENRIAAIIARAPAFYAGQNVARKKGVKHFVTGNRQRGGIASRISQVVRNFLSK